MFTAESLRRARAVRLLCLDVDGTLTDGRIYPATGVAENGRAFHVLDGQGIRRFIADGGVVALITAADEDDLLLRRAAQLEIQHVHQAVEDKLSVVKSLLQAESLHPAEAAFVGDDMPDIAPMRYVGLSCAPPESAAEALAAAHYICTRPGGGGAVREVCDLIMRARELSEG